MTNKELALQCMERLKLHHHYIRKFKHSGIPFLFECYHGSPIKRDGALTRKIKEIEEEFNCLVYAVTHEITDFGETYSMLCIQDDRDYYVLDNGPDKYFVFGYVWNVQAEYLSEFYKNIVIRSSYCAIKRE